MHPRKPSRAAAAVIAALSLILLLGSCMSSPATQAPGAEEPAAEEPAAEEAAGSRLIRVSQPITIVDRAGAALGDGEVRLYAPATVGYDESFEVRLEIEVTGALAGTLAPAPSATPVIGTPRPTPSPLPLADAQFIEVREFMGARLGGLDAGRFRIEPVPPDGLRQMQPAAINWWKWNVQPAGPEAAGLRRLEVIIYLPAALDDGTPHPEDRNLIPLEITVEGPPAPPPTPTPTPSLGGAGSTFDLWVGRLVALGTLVSLLYGAYRLLRRRPRRT